MSRKRKRTSGLKLAMRPGSPFWQITGTLRGVSVRESTGTPIREQAEKLRIARENEIINEAVHGTKAVATFARVANLYVDLKPSRDTVVLRRLEEHFGHMNASKIGDEDVHAFIRKYYPTTGVQGIVRQVYTPLIAILNVGAQSNPPLCDRPRFTKPSVERKIVQYADDEWLKKFLSWQPTKPTSNAPDVQANYARSIEAWRRLRAIVLLMTTTGCRVAEACRLTWADVLFEKGEAILTRTKSGDPRRLVLTEGMVDVLRELSTGKIGERVFGFRSRFAVNTALRRACAKIGVRYYSTHKLGRHAFAARLLANGQTLAVVAKAGGWSEKSLRLVATVYGHLEQSTVDEAVRDASEGLGIEG